MGHITITSGIFKGRKINTPDGDRTRPLLTRLRKSLADILRPQLPGARILDLFGGSGAIAFELVSNGAAEAVIAELHVQTAGLIQENARALGIDDAVACRPGDGLAVLQQLAGEGSTFDIVIVAPPYNMALQQKALDLLEEGSVLRSEGLVIVQREDREPFIEVSGRLSFERTRKYGRTVFDFYRKIG